jgi:hypothetical protein
MRKRGLLSSIVGSINGQTRRGSATLFPPQRDRDTSRIMTVQILNVKFQNLSYSRDIVWHPLCQVPR